MLINEDFLLLYLCFSILLNTDREPKDGFARWKDRLGENGREKSSSSPLMSYMSDLLISTGS